MNIKLPACYDVSHWKEIPDFTLVSPKPLLFITKATEHVSFVDSKFVRFFAGMKQIRVRRGAYHFHRKAFKATDQAAHFCNTVRDQISIDDVLILDVEEGGETAAQLKVWFEFVQLQFPENLLMLYSRKNILDPIPMNYAEREFFKQIPTWVAGYPVNADALAVMPTYYTPDQSKYGPSWLWQYSDKGQVTGIEGDVDLNWIDPVFAAILDDGGTVPPGGGSMNGTAKEVLGKTGTIRTSPEVVSGNDSGKRVAAFSTIEFVRVVDGKSVPADKWFLLPDGNYLNYIITGRAYYQILTQPTPDPEPPAEGVADMPFTFTLGGGTSPYVEQTITGIVKAK